VCRNAAAVIVRAHRCLPAIAEAPRSGGPTEEDAAIEAEVAVRMAGVTRRFNDTVAVDAIDLVIPRGSVVGVIGPSGSGKTTTIRMITGSLGPTEGKVEVLGENPSTFRRSTRERIGYMPQKFSLYPDLTVGENVDFAAAIYGLLFWRRWRRRRAVLELVELWDVRRRRAGQLSGGMQRRLELAASLVHEPDLLILDEPTAGVDPILRRTVWDEIHRVRDRGVTAIVTTQYVTEAEECNEVALISGGRLIAFGPPDQLRHDALGGDVVEVTMSGLFDASTLAAPEGVRGIRQTGPRTFELIVDDAGTATADMVGAMGASGAQVEAIREIRPTFEDVFAHLVERDRAAREAEGDHGDIASRDEARRGAVAAASEAAVASEPPATTEPAATTEPPATAEIPVTTTDAAADPEAEPPERATAPIVQSDDPDRGAA
jgi:ABC-2 type transport system ATP-binding protein